MCGILGVFGRPVPDHALAAATRSLRHRGPDGAAWRRLRADAALGHTRLAIIDLDQRADQPMAGLDGRLTIVFNGEIYNAPELRAAIPDYPYRTDHSDTEAILAAYWRWGDDFVSQLRGMFAFALWDGASERLLLAVDRFSIKPLYVSQRSGSLAFASTAAALEACGTRLTPNLSAIHSFLGDGTLETGTDTFFDHVSQLPAATLGIWSKGALTLRKYWQPPRPAPRDVGLEEISAWLDDSLDCHLLSDVPVGICLSSGVDSNVLRLRAESLGEPLCGFTFSFPGEPYDEAARLRENGVHGADWTVTPIDPHRMWRDLIDVTRAIELPLGGVATYGHYRNAQVARDAGYKVLLAGEGADETFAGYKYYAEAAIGQLWSEGRKTEADALFRAFAAREPEAWRTSPARLARALARREGADLKAPDGTSLAGSFVTGEFAAMTPKLAPPPRVEGHPARAAMWRDLAHLKLPKLLRWQDRCYMAHGVEVRVPYLDHILVERLAETPIETLLQGGLTKSSLRALAGNMAGAGAFERPKLYVATPQREWLKRDLRTEVEDLLDPAAALVRHGIVDLERLRAAFRAYADGPELGNSFFIWKFIAMECLFQAFFEARAIQPARATV